jgi:hypothetical protein
MPKKQLPEPKRSSQDPTELLQRLTRIEARLDRLETRLLLGNGNLIGGSAGGPAVFGSGVRI